MSYSFDYLLKSTNLNDLFPELSNFELPDLSTKIGWEDWKNSRLAQFIDNGFEYLDLDKELFDRIFQGVFNIAKEDEAALSGLPTCEEPKSEPLGPSPSPFLPDAIATSPAIETITIGDKIPNNSPLPPFNIQAYNPYNMMDNTQTMSKSSDNNNPIHDNTLPINSYNTMNNMYALTEEQKTNQNSQPLSAVAAIGRTFTSVYTTAINTAQNAWQQNQCEEENKSAHWSNFVKKFTSFVSPGYMITLARDSAAYFQLKVPSMSLTEGWGNDARLRRIYVNRACANYGNSSKAREFSNEEKGFILDCWVSSTSSTSRHEKIRNCCSACALHWEKKGRSKKFPENNEKFVLIEASHEHVFEADGTHQIKLRSNCSSTCQNVKGKKLELNFSLFDLTLKREFLSSPISIRITRSGRSFEEPLPVDFA